MDMIKSWLHHSAKSISPSTFRNRNQRMIISCQSVNVKNGLTPVTHSQSRNWLLSWLSIKQTTTEMRRKKKTICRRRQWNEKKNAHERAQHRYGNIHKWFRVRATEKQIWCLPIIFPIRFGITNLRAREKKTFNVLTWFSSSFYFASRTFFERLIKFHNIIHTWMKFKR